jgi:molybdate transport system substrate-binding protein
VEDKKRTRRDLVMGKTWKKGMVAVMTAVMVSGALAGCGSGAGQKTETAAIETVQTEAAAEAAKDETAAAESSVAATEVAEETEILVAAAASLKNAYEEELIPMFEAQYPGVTVKGTYDSSGKLQTQIEEGLEADVFMSAAKKQMKALDEEGMIDSDSIVDLLENKIVLIVPTGSDKGIQSFEDIVKADSIALGDPASVPAGQYSEEALTNLGLWDQIQDKTSFGTNVTEVLNQVAAGSADAGIVYATDAASMADQVEVVAEAPEGSLKTKVIYPVAVVKDSANAEVAANFVEFLTTDEAMKVFETYGFNKGE